MPRPTGDTSSSCRTSADGWMVYYIATAAWWRPGPLWQVALGGGQPAFVTDRLISQPAVPPDKQLLAYHYYDPQADPEVGVEVAPAEGGPPLRRFARSPCIGWMPDGRELLYVHPDFMNVWAQPIDGGPPEQLTGFKAGQTWGFSFSRDGRQLALARGSDASDVLLITDFR